MHFMSGHLEDQRTVQITQTGLTTGVRMNESSKALGSKRGLAVGAPKLLISPNYYYNWMCLQGPIKDPI